MTADPNKSSENLIRLTKHSFSDEALNQMVAVVRSGNLVQGQKVAAFEEALGRYLTVKHAVLVSSGTAALHLAVLALGLGAGDEVIVPAFTFPATANAVEITGARCVVVDIKLDDFCIDSEQIEALITERTKAILPVHEFGMPCDIEAVMEISKRHQLAVIEDAACAFGSEFNGKKAGTFGVAGCFSLHPRKALTTGEGGLVITESDELAANVRRIRNHGMSPKDGRIDFVEAGLNYRLTDFQAVLGHSQLAGFEESVKKRIEMAAILDAELRSLPWLEVPQSFAGRRSVYQSYHILCSPEVNRKKVIDCLRERGIESNIGAHALAHLTYFQKKYSLRPEDFPAASRAYTHGLALPIGTHLSQRDVEHLIESLRSVKV